MSSTPELPQSLRWLAEPAPLQLTALRGHVALLLFWRLGCIHSRHALADLERLHRSLHGRPFAALAIHTPQHPAERDPERLAACLDELGSTLAVAVDAEREAFDRFGADAWPTLVLIDAAGERRFQGRGEPDFDRLHGAVDALLQQASSDGLAAAAPFAPAARPLPPARPLQPTRLCRDGERIWIADTGNHRLLLVDADGAVQRTIGARRGFEDGAAAAARLCRPRGLCPVDDGLLVADAGNHALRLVDRGSGLVRTLAGNGRRGSDHFGGGFGSQQPLSSPWDVCRHLGATYVAMAGTHQLWQFDLHTQAATSWLGSGQQERRDGGDEAGMSQPSALLGSDDRLFVSDAGNGAVRTVDLGHARVGTLTAALQRPDGLALHRGRLLVADAWAGAVLRFDLAAADPQRAGPEILLDRSTGLVEPSGLLLLGDKLLIADERAGCIWQVDLAGEAPAATLQVWPLQEG